MAEPTIICSKCKSEIKLTIVLAAPLIESMLKFASVLLALLTLAGCASSGAVTNASPISTSKPVSLDFVLVETSSALDGLESEKASLKDLIITGLEQTGQFGSVSGSKADVNSGSGIKVSAEIKEIQKVSESSRIWLGALAGRARILVRVTVTDLNSGYQIQIFTAEGKSGESARAGTTGEAIQRAAEQVVAELAKISRLTSQ